MANAERRSGTDRRQRRRGGRREGDAAGTILLVLVVTANQRERVRVQSVLQDVGFAVALCDSALAALQATRDLKPDVILADVHEGVALRGRVGTGRNGRAIPIVDLTGDSDAAVGRVRQGLRQRR
jgi:CheY-like chemotaxis protein